LKYNGIKTRHLHIGDNSFWQDVKEIDAFIYRFSVPDEERYIASIIIPIIETELDKKCYPNSATVWTYDDKIKQYYQSKSLGLPMVPSRVFFNIETAMEWAESASYPVVFKLPGGAGSTNVVLVHTFSEAKKIINRIFASGIKSGQIPTKGNLRWYNNSLYKHLRLWAGKKYRQIISEDTVCFWQVYKNCAMFQQFLPHNEYDTRITVIGDRAFAFRRINRLNDFRSSGSGLIDYSLEKIDLVFVEKSFEASRKMRVQSMAYDWLYGENREPYFCEMSYGFDGPAVARCSGYWDSRLNWHEGHLTPEYCILQDLLGIPDLKNPGMLHDFSLSVQQT
jgi:glutathione synthase/RimK-type ligase-like ATP-grasp enzyme